MKKTFEQMTIDELNKEYFRALRRKQYKLTAEIVKYAKANNL
jgi:hypothetical protein